MLNVENIYRQTFRVLEAGHALKIKLVWMDIPQHWYISVTEGDVVWVRNRQVVELEWLVQRPELGGDLYAAPLHSETTDPGAGAWGVTHGLIWAARNEIEAVYA